MARAVRKIFRLNGTFFPSIPNMANENAMSVAMGIPHPCEISPEKPKAGCMFQKPIDRIH